MNTRQLRQGTYKRRIEQEFQIFDLCNEKCSGLKKGST